MQQAKLSAILLSMSSKSAKKVLSGIQPSGKPHLGNYLGAIKNHIKMQQDYSCHIFIADLHALTTVRDAKKLHESCSLRHFWSDFFSVSVGSLITPAFRRLTSAKHRMNPISLIFTL